MLIKELLIKARDTLPQKLCVFEYYNHTTNQYCGLGWICHIAGLSNNEIDHITPVRAEVFRALPLNLKQDMIEANDGCTWEHERHDRVKHVLNNWIERLSNDC